MSALVFLDLKEMEKHAQVEISIFNYQTFHFSEDYPTNTWQKGESCHTATKSFTCFCRDGSGHEAYILIDRSYIDERATVVRANRDLLDMVSVVKVLYRLFIQYYQNKIRTRL